jgi:hypothetical protein
LIDDAEFQALATEIDVVLTRVRQLEPVTEGISAFPDHEPGALLVGVQGSLGVLIADAFAGQETVTSLVTGSEEFDSLVRQLCLESARLYAERSAVYFSFSDLMIVRVAAHAFSDISGVRYADPQWNAGDGSDIALEKVGADWYVVFREASGDCPSGCIVQELYYFTVSVGGVLQWCEHDALENPNLRRLAETWGAQTLLVDTAPCQQPEALPQPEPSQQPASLLSTGGLP